MLIEKLGSLYCTVIISIFMMILLSVSTFFEFIYGISTVQKIFYQTKWLDLVLSLFWINIFYAVILRFPFKKKHIGFLLTHIGILGFLAGALISRIGGLEGQMTLLEKRSSGEMVYSHDEQTGVALTKKLPFLLYLEDFRKEDYSGTTKLKSLESDVIIYDALNDIQIRKTIHINRPLDYMGFRIFQSSFIQDYQGESSIFRITKNPGLLWIYMSSVMIFIGAFLQFYVIK